MTPNTPAFLALCFLKTNIVQGNPANKAAKPTKKINISLLTIPLIKNISLLTGPS